MIKQKMCKILTLYFYVCFDAVSWWKCSQWGIALSVLKFHVPLVRVAVHGFHSRPIHHSRPLDLGRYPLPMFCALKVSHGSVNRDEWHAYIKEASLTDFGKYYPKGSVHSRTSAVLILAGLRDVSGISR